MYEHLTLLAMFIFVYSLVAGRLKQTPLSGPIVWVLFGLALSLTWLGLPPGLVPKESIRTLAEISLALVLFTDAANVDLNLLKRNSRLPQRLLLIGLPLTNFLGFLGVLAIFPSRMRRANDCELCLLMDYRRGILLRLDARKEAVSEDCRIFCRAYFNC